MGAQRAASLAGGRQVPGGAFRGQRGQQRRPATGGHIGPHGRRHLGIGSFSSGRAGGRTGGGRLQRAENRQGCAEDQKDDAPRLEAQSATGEV